jgi:hypothetical protein
MDDFQKKYGLLASTDLKPRNEIDVPLIFVTDSFIKEGTDCMEIRAHIILDDNSSIPCYITVYNHNGR